MRPLPHHTMSTTTEQRAKNAEYMRTWNAAHPDKVKASRWKCIERRRKNSKEWRTANRSHVSAYNKAWRESHPEYEEKWRDANPIRMRARSSRHRARKLGNGGTYTAEDIQTLFYIQDGRCAGCSMKFCKSRRYEVDHVIPVSKGGSNNPDNLQLLCGTCNKSKSAMSPEVWAVRIGKLFV